MPGENLKPTDLRLKLLGEKKKGLRILSVYKSHAYFYSIVDLVPKVKRRKEFAIICRSVDYCHCNPGVILDREIQELEI